MEHSRKLLVLGGLLLAMQLAAAGRPLFGLHTGARTVDGAQVVSEPAVSARPGSNLADRAAVVSRGAWCECSSGNP